MDFLDIKKDGLLLFNKNWFSHNLNFNIWIINLKFTLWLFYELYLTLFLYLDLHTFLDKSYYITNFVKYMFYNMQFNKICTQQDLKQTYYNKDIKNLEQNSTDIYFQKLMNHNLTLIILRRIFETVFLFYNLLQFHFLLCQVILFFFIQSIIFLT